MPLNAMPLIASIGLVAQARRLDIFQMSFSNGMTLNRWWPIPAMVG